MRTRIVRDVKPLMARNIAESTAYQADNLISEHGEKLPDAVKSDIQSKTSEVRTVLADSDADADRVKAATEALQQSMIQAGQHIHTGSENQNGGELGWAMQADLTAGTQPGTENNDTVEGRFREV